MDIRKIKRSMGHHPINKPIPGREKEMSKNPAGGYGFNLNVYTRVWQSLLSRPGETYYQSEEENWRDLITNYNEILQADPEGFLKLIEKAIPLTFRPESVLLAFALLFDSNVGEIRLRAREIFVKNIKTLNYLYKFLEIWKIVHPHKSNSFIRKLVAMWIAEKAKEGVLEYQVAKFFGRNNWDFADLLLVFHPPVNKIAPESLPLIKDALNYKYQGYKAEFYTEFFKLRRYFNVEKPAPSEVAKIIREKGLFREIIPDTLRKDPEVTRALAERAPFLSFIKSIPELAEKGLLASENYEFIEFTKSKIMKAAEKLHPYDLAFMTLIAQRGETRRRSFTVPRDIKDTLEKATLRAFNRFRESNESPFAGKTVLIAVDTSGSMRGGETTMGVEPLESAAVFAFVLAHIAHSYIPGTFSDRFISKSHWDFKQPIWDLIGMLDREGACCSTNAGSVVEWLLDNEKKVDVVVMISDSQSWQGGHFSELIKEYRRRINPDTKAFLINLLYTRSPSIMDPKDYQSFHLVGDDPSVFKWMEMAMAGKLSPDYVREIIGKE